MRGVSERMARAAVVALAMFLAGCSLLPWVPGEVTECMPQHVEKCRADTAFFVENTKKPVKTALEAALKRRGFEVVERAVESDVVVKTAIDSWEYNDIGFSGPGERADVRLTITIVDRRRHTVLGRWRVDVRSDFRIIDRCVDKM